VLASNSIQKFFLQAAVAVVLEIVEQVELVELAVVAQVPPQRETQVLEHQILAAAVEVLVFSRITQRWPAEKVAQVLS
jgi:hypothetical protein